jgi:hypothetical protein
MKTATVLALAAVVLLVLVPVAAAAEKGAKGGGAVSGKITKVDENAITVNVKGESKSIAIDAETKITVNGKEGTKVDLKADQSVSVTLSADGSKAVKIAAKDGGAGGGKKKEK